MGGLPTGTVNGFAVHPSDPAVMYVAMRAGVHRSTDAGRTWSAPAGGPTDVVAVAVDPKRPAIVYAATAAGRIHVSSDGGATWHAR